MVGSKQKSEKGFTIIEVLIVLAIAGLVMVIVFLAVPSLQRNSRNNSRKTDARFIATQRLQYNLEQNTSASISPGGYDCSGDVSSKLFCQYLIKGLGHYEMADVTFHSNTNVRPSTPPSITDPQMIRTDSHVKCAANGRDAEISDLVRDMTVLYMIETGGGWQQVCVENGLAPKS